VGPIHRRQPILRLLLTFALSLFLLTAIPSLSRSIWHVPKGKPILIDGKLGKMRFTGGVLPGKWPSAARVPP
jgi:hypothetical protein